MFQTSYIVAAILTAILTWALHVRRPASAPGVSKSVVTAELAGV
jgi:hypothetical protein